MAKGTGGSPLHFDRSKYPPESFIIPGQDQNGNSVREWCRVVPMLDRAIDVIFASRKFPFKSKGDLMRWCIKTGVERLEEMEPVQGSVMTQVEMMFRILQDEQHHQAFMTVFDTMNKTIGMHIQAQALGEARRVVAEMDGLIDRIENDYWRERYKAEMRTKFGYLLDGKIVKGVGMQEFDGGAEGVEEENAEDYV